MNKQIWVLGATGRSGRGIARRLHESGHSLVLAGRDAARLRSVAGELEGTEIAMGAMDSLLAQMSDAAPAVVVNTVGPFARTTEQVIRACPPGTHYVDIANEMPAFLGAVALHAALVEHKSTAVTGTGFGVLATESLVVRMCEEWPEPAQVRVDAIPSLVTEAGAIGTALAGSILDGFPDGGRQVKGGGLTRSQIAGQRTHLTTPSGDAVTTAALPTGDLVAAWRASGAETVVSASNMIPSGPAIRALLPAVSLVLKAGVIRRFAINRLAKVQMKAQDMPREFSWGHCAMEWADGTRRGGWLQLSDAQEFTVAAAAEVAHRLAAGDVAPGAYTPAALFGSALAEDLGGKFMM